MIRAETPAKMTIYCASAPLTVELCQPVDGDDYWTVWEQVNGHPRAATWQPVAMHILERDHRKRKYRRSDSPYFGSDALVFRPAAIEALAPLLHASGELLPLRCETAELWMFNPWLIDALDVEASTIQYFNTGRVMDIPKPVFRPAALRGVDAFKIPNKSTSSTYLSQRFVDAWHAAGLKGLEFDLEWTEP